MQPVTMAPLGFIPQSGIGTEGGDPAPATSSDDDGDDDEKGKGRKPGVENSPNKVPQKTVGGGEGGGPKDADGDGIVGEK